MARNIWVFFGLIAGGKSFLADAWARKRRINCFNSDRVRKELAGVDPLSRQGAGPGQGIYTREFSRRTYDELLRLAEETLSNNSSVILDASYLSRDERARVAELARRLGAGIKFIFCTCPEEEVKKRLLIRAADPRAVSDGCWEIYLRQRESFLEPRELTPAELTTLATDQPLVDLLAQLEMMEQKR